MTKYLAPLLLALCAAPALAEKEAFKVLHVDELARALESKSPPAVYDANNRGTREHAGIIPGAKLLSSYSKYDVVKELPADKKTPLVFYCANTMCTASHDAARRALDAGYTDVGVMVDGVFGWKKAGRPVSGLAGEARETAPKEAQAMVQAGTAVIVDVREDEERREVVPGARSLPMSRAGDEKAWGEFVAGLPKDKTVVFYCASGKRAKRAAEKLSKQGFATGFFESADQWKEAGLPVEKGPAR